MRNVQEEKGEALSQEQKGGVFTTTRGGCHEESLINAGLTPRGDASRPIVLSDAAKDLFVTVAHAMRP